eukprot:gene18619-23792_t
MIVTPGGIGAYPALVGQTLTLYGIDETAVKAGQEAQHYMARERYFGRKIVFTNGCFDVLHIGHIRLLLEAANAGDILVVGLNSDASVKRLKGEGRPIHNQDLRAEALAALVP